MRRAPCAARGAAARRKEPVDLFPPNVGRAHLSRDAPAVLGDQKALAKHIAEQLIP
ncbi:MAG TPA: hypothetical protein VNT03_08655 [Baekduia sp.]|nr:hypothetical protein [Baekduia sp.]